MVTDASSVFEAARQGEPWARRAIGAALDAMVHALNPEVIVIGGGLSAWGELFRQAIEDEAFRRAMPCFREGLAAKLAALGSGAGVAGAALAAVDWAV